MVTQRRLWDMTTMDMHRRPGGGWPRDARLSMRRERKCWCGSLVDMGEEKRIRNTVRLRRRVAGLEGHCRQVWNEEWGMVGRHRSEAWALLERGSSVREGLYSCKG